jgi:GDP-4-dehydro-6-deoxy-D-mannose reductase
VSHRALITGINGFVGGFLAEHLIQSGDAVRGTSIRGQWEPNSASELADHIDLIPWDLGQPMGLAIPSRQKIADFQPNVIYHLAALSVPDDCGDQTPTPSAMAVNVEGTRRVLELAASLSSHPRVIAVSSSHVYAQTRGEHGRLDENAPLGPTRGYGLTKLAAEEEVQRAVAQHGVGAVIVRPFQHAGPRQSNRMMLAQWASQIVDDNTTPIKVHTLDAFIDLCDVRDVVRAYRLLAAQGVAGQVYNVGSGIARRSGDVLEMLLQAAKSSRPVVECRPGIKHDPIANTARLRQTTGWQPEIPLETTVADTLAWWQQPRK